MTDLRRGGLLIGGLAFLFLPAAAAFAYSPGTGTLLTTGFETTLGSEWEKNNGNPTSPWKQVIDGVDRSLFANGNGPYPGAATKTWTRRYTHPVPSTSYSIAFEYRAELGTGYSFDLEVEQRNPILRKYRLRVDGQGAV